MMQDRDTADGPELPQVHIFSTDGSQRKPQSSAVRKLAVKAVSSRSSVYPDLLILNLLTVVFVFSVASIVGGPLRNHSRVTCRYNRKI